MRGKEEVVKATHITLDAGGDAYFIFSLLPVVAKLFASTRTYDRLDNFIRVSLGEDPGLIGILVLEMAVPNDSLHEHYRDRGKDGILGLVPLKDGSEEAATFSHDSAMTSIGGLQSSGFDPAMSHYSLSRMSRLGQQAHITQQFRREKLRVQGSHHASPPQSCRASEGSAFPSSASQQAGLSQSSERLEMSLNPLQTALGDFGHFPRSAHTHPAFNTELVSLQCYNTSTGEEAATLPENGNNLLKASVLGALLKPAEVEACFDGLTTQVGNSPSALPKIKNWTLESKNVPGYNLSPSLIRGTDVFDDGQGGFYSQGISLGAGTTIQSHLAGSNAANECIETYGPVSINSEDGVQPYLLRQAYTENARQGNLGFARADLDRSSGPGQNTSDGNVNQLYERIPTPSPFPTQRHRDLQCFIPSISTLSSDRCGSSYDLSQTTPNYGQSGDWVNVGTELLLLPGSEAMGRSQSSDLHGNVTTLARSVSLDEMVDTNSVALTRWDKLGCRLGNIGRICEAENFSKGSVRQSPGSLSLFLSSDQRRQSSIPGLETNFSNSGPLGLLRNSKYLRAAQQVLDDFCNVGRSDSFSLRSQTDQKSQAWMKAGGARVDGEERHDQTIHLKSFDRKTSPVSVSVLLPTRPELGATHLSADERSHLQMKKARLIGMVEELDRRYRQYRDQMQLVATSFESGTGLGAAAPYTALARQAMSRRFRSLRDTVSEQIQKACKLVGEEVSNVPILNRGETPRLRVLDQRLRYQRALQQIGTLQQQAWRPQRGLPERSVSVLRAWLFEHFLHPYPKDSEKLMLARLTGLSRSQVSNWFINARVRLWKPMVEEMYLEESKEIDEEDTSGAASDSTSGQNGKEEAAEGYRAIANGRQKNDAAKERASSSFTQNLQGKSDQQNYTSDAGGTSDSVYDVSEAVGYGAGGLQGKSGYGTASTQLQQCSSSLTKETGSNWNNPLMMGDLDEEGGVVVNKNGGATTLSLALPSEQQPSAFHHVFAPHNHPALPF